MYIALYTGPVIQNCEHTELDALRLYKLFLCIPFAGIGMGVAIFLIAWAIYALMAKWDHASNGYKDDAEANAEADANGRANN